MADNTISWTAPEYIHYEKNPRWYTLLWAAGALLLLYAIWTRDVIMFATFVLLLGMVYGYSKRKPKQISIQLTGKGVHLNDQVYSYSNLKGFWIFYNPPEIKTLSFQTTSRVNSEIVLQLDDQDPNEIREFLLQYLPENLEKEESFTDRLSRRLKF